MPRMRLPAVVAAALMARLPKVERRWHAASFLVLVLICTDTLYLLAHRGLALVGEGVGAHGERTQPATGLYQAAVLGHSLIGYVLSLALLVFIALHVPKVLRRVRNLWLLAPTGAVIVAAYVFLVYSGTYFFLHSKSTANAGLYWGHMAVSAGFIAVYAGHRLLAAKRFPVRAMAGLFGTAAALAAIMLVADVAAVASRPDPARDRVALAPAKDATGFAPASGINPAAPFFPSPVALASGHSEVDTVAFIGSPDAELMKQVRAEVDKFGFAKVRKIGAEGCERCHADTVAQWASSAHRFSSFNNPYYVASLDPLRANDAPPNAAIKQHLEAYGFKDVASGEIKSQWCAGCHDPALIFQGKMRNEIDRGEVKAQVGLACMACHQIKDIPNHTGSGNYVWDDEFHDPYVFSDSNSLLATSIHDLYLKANPEQHKSDMLRPVMREARFCSTCHKVSLEGPLNEYRYVRGQDEWDAWHDSGVALNAARTFYQPAEAKQCQTCHMPLEAAVLGDVAAKDGKVRSHRFLGANTALPFLRGDTEQVARTEAYMRGMLRVNFAGLRVNDRVGLTTEQPVATLTVAAGESPELSVVVRNLGVGHTFPGGTNDSNQGWVELTMRDENGRELLRAGQLDAKGQVVENTRIYNVVFIDKSSNRITMRNAQDIAALVYAAVIPPGTADQVRFRVPVEKIPADVHKVTVTARVLWRKFNRTFSDFARGIEPKSFANIGPDLPITELARATAEITIDRPPGADAAADPEPTPAASLTMQTETAVPPAQRHLLTHDYAIGLLVQGDTLVGRQVLQGLVARHPECANCVRSLARIYLTDRDYPAARATLTEHEKRWPNDPQGAWLWAGLLRGEGHDGEALKALDRVIQVYPDDREAWRLRQEITYRSGDFAAAADASAHILQIDPEDATARYYAMLSERALGDTANSRLQQSAYRYYQRDESAQQMTLDFRRGDPVSNFQSQPIRVYDLQ